MKLKYHKRNGMIAHIKMNQEGKLIVLGHYLKNFDRQVGREPTTHLEIQLKM